MSNRSLGSRDHHRYASGSDNAHYYWSCTEHPDNSSHVYNVQFTDGHDDWNDKDNYKLSTRPVRAELEPLFPILLLGGVVDFCTFCVCLQEQVFNTFAHRFSGVVSVDLPEHAKITIHAIR